ncbi:ATP-binding cassette domain-containing protein [Halalkalibacter hemicellulosilyticus]|uniref:Probable antibiotic-transport ATP-binding protein ABC transporter n=1 Tax=Halalkalibacter hemicellulosilyticusJCM 9152 TaxID=1236971 RepID=W4QDP1_9BACI|nr:probable antibiotic-transport ATP-binding protein ABC transporter [Halalkalibacter hemicellulosilyticusJCM 9152]
MIQVKNLTFTYPKNLKPTIQGVDVSIDKGEIFGFLGPSGAGKSTLQKILIGVLKGYKGDVTFYIII